MKNKRKEDPPCSTCPLQANVWSFAMKCSEAPLVKHQMSRKAILIIGKELTTLTKECWVEDPSQRPT